MKHWRIGRRGFLKATAGVAAASTALMPTQARPSEPEHQVEYGEPYELAGKRLAFLNWHYIRSGSFGWYDKWGQKVGLTSAAPPAEAHLRRSDSPHGIRLVAQHAEHIGPLFQAEHPWEQEPDGAGGVALTTVLKDGGMYRGWGAPFTTSGNPPGQQNFMYYESSDGLSWKRPNLGIVEFRGNKNNNIVNIFETDGGTIFIDPSAPAAERYKLFAEGPFSPAALDAYFRRRPDAWDPKRPRKPGTRMEGVKGGTSPDGLHWNMIPEPLVMEVTDTQLTAYYDEQRHKYVAYTRSYPASLRSPRAHLDGHRTWGVARRSIGRSETSNFREFPLHQTMLEPGPHLLPSQVLYTNGKTTIPGAPDHHLLFPSVWDMAVDRTSIHLATSHDGRLWHFLEGSPVFETGPFGAFDGGVIFAHPNLVELLDGRFVLPYTGYDVPHKYPRKLWKYAPGYAAWPKGRLVALEAPEYGEFATVAVMPPGRRLRINALTDRAGSILVEVAELGGKPLPQRSFQEATPVFGDLHWSPLNWNGQEDLGHKEGSSIMLRFRLDHAKIFGLEFA
jgi:hypothetical protein